MLKRLDKEFFNRPANVVAKELLGKIVIRHSKDGDMGGFIVDVEAYMGSVDPASYSYRNYRHQDIETLYGPYGHVFIYPTEGGYCFNITCGSKDDPSSVLIRAIEPCFGMSRISRNMVGRNIWALVNSPVRLCETLLIDLSLDGDDIEGDRLGVYDDSEDHEYEITVSTRLVKIDDSQAPFRFCIATSPFVAHNTKGDA